MIFPTVKFENFEQFENIVDELGEIVNEIYDTENPDLIEQFVKHLKENYSNYYKALWLKEREEWVTDWWSYYCFLICEYELTEKNYEKLSQEIWEMAGSRWND